MVIGSRCIDIERMSTMSSVSDCPQHHRIYALCGLQSSQAPPLHQKTGGLQLITHHRELHREAMSRMSRFVERQLPARDAFMTSHLVRTNDDASAICIVCRDTPKDPVQIHHCQHILCNDCAQEWFAAERENTRCPQCQQVLFSIDRSHVRRNVRICLVLRLLSVISLMMFTFRIPCVAARLLHLPVVAFLGLGLMLYFIEMRRLEDRADWRYESIAWKGKLGVTLVILEVASAAAIVRCLIL